MTAGQAVAANAHASILVLSLLTSFTAECSPSLPCCTSIPFGMTWQSSWYLTAATFRGSPPLKASTKFLLVASISSHSSTRTSKNSMNAHALKGILPQLPHRSVLGRHGSVSLCRDGQENKMAAAMHVYVQTLIFRQLVNCTWLYIEAYICSLALPQLYSSTAMLERIAKVTNLKAVKIEFRHLRFLLSSSFFFLLRCA